MKDLKPRMIRRYFLILLAVSIVIMLAGLASGAEFLCVAGAVIAVLGLILHFVLYRCPHCGHFLDRHDVEFCPQCGKKVNG